MSPVPLTCAVMVGFRPAPAVTGAVQTLTSAWSLAVQWATSVNVSPAESVTPLASGLAAPQTPTWTTSRLPGPSATGRLTDRLPAPPVCADACCTNDGAVAGPGVTTLDGADAGEVPAAFVAVTVNVYAVPLVSPVTTVAVAGAATWTGAWATEPAYGVTVYPVIGLPLLFGAVQPTVAEPSPAVAATDDGADGALGGCPMWTIEATDGTPLSLRMNSM
jgi:hypothetical protein